MQAKRNDKEREVFKNFLHCNIKLMQRTSSFLLKKDGMDKRIDMNKGIFKSNYFFLIILCFKMRYCFLYEKKKILANIAHFSKLKIKNN